MKSRTEKNKGIATKIKKEKSFKLFKIILIIMISIFIIISLIYSYMHFIEPHNFISHEIIIKDKKIPDSFHGIKILHLSDLLYGSTINEKSLKVIMNKVTNINPDIIVYTGDIIDADYKLTKEDITFLNNFFTNLPYTLGRYAIDGENDNNDSMQILINSDFTILDNDYSLVYNIKNTPILFCGLSNELNSKRIEAFINDNDYYTITLIHNFDRFNNLYPTDLILAGHNLNGEIVIPFYKKIFNNNYYNDSFYIINNTKIYISNGLGSIHQLRLNNPPSMNVYRLLNK